MDFFRNIFNFPLAEQVANLHGLFSTLALIGFGAVFVLIILIRKGYGQEKLHKPLAYVLGIQTLLIGLLSTTGIVAYVAYRTNGGARSFLLSTPGTAWLHNLVFEYKEYLGGVAPWLLIMVAFFLVLYLGPRLYQNKVAQRFILASNIVSIIFLIIVATLAVLVSKIAPLQKFPVGSDLFTRGGNIVLLTAFLTVLVLGGIFWLITRRAKRTNQDGENHNSLAAVMYGSSIGLTLMWALNMAKEASPALKNSIAYINSVGPYSGVVIWSLVAIAAGTLVVRLATLKVKSLSLNAAAVTLIACSALQVLMFFPPFYHLFIGG
jgi:hypothetical protein